MAILKLWLDSLDKILDNGDMYVLNLMQLNK